MNRKFTDPTKRIDPIELWRAAEGALRDVFLEYVFPGYMTPTEFIDFARDDFRPLFKYLTLDRISENTKNVRYFLARLIPRLEFYLDTNVLVHMLTDVAGPSIASREFFLAVRKLGIAIRVWSPTMDELSHVIDRTIRHDVDKAVIYARNHRFPENIGAFAREYLSKRKWGNIQEYINELHRRKVGLFRSLEIKVDPLPKLDLTDVITLRRAMIENLDKHLVMKAHHDAICVLSTLKRSTERKFVITDLEGRDHTIDGATLLVTCDSVLATQVCDIADVVVLCLELAYMLDKAFLVLEDDEGFYEKTERQIRHGFSVADRILQWLMSELSSKYSGGE